MEENKNSKERELVHLVTNIEIDKIIQNQSSDIIMNNDINKAPLFSPDGKILERDYIEKEEIKY